MKDNRHGQSITILEQISSMKFEKMLLEYWELSNLPNKRLFREFKEVWKWFYHSHGINKTKFNDLFLRLLKDNTRFLTLHGSPTGSYNDKTGLTIPDDRNSYGSYHKKRYGIWSIDLRYTRIIDWCGKR